MVDMKKFKKDAEYLPAKDLAQKHHISNRTAYDLLEQMGMPAKRAGEVHISQSLFEMAMRLFRPTIRG